MCCVPPASMSVVARMELLIPSNSTFQISILEAHILNIAKEYKSCLFLAAVLCLGFVCPQNASRPPYACQCLKDVKDREDCGHVGITAEQCTEKGCCFDATEPGVPWCFHPSGEREQYANEKNDMIRSFTSICKENDHTTRKNGMWISWYNLQEVPEDWMLLR